MHRRSNLSTFKQMPSSGNHICPLGGQSRSLLRYHGRCPVLDKFYMVMALGERKPSPANEFE